MGFFFFLTGIPLDRNKTINAACRWIKKLCIWISKLLIWACNRHTQHKAKVLRRQLQKGHHKENKSAVEGYANPVCCVSTGYMDHLNKCNKRERITPSHIKSVFQLHKSAYLLRADKKIVSNSPAQWVTEVRLIVKTDTRLQLTMQMKGHYISFHSMHHSPAIVLPASVAQSYFKIAFTLLNQSYVREKLIQFCFIS